MTNLYQRRHRTCRNQFELNNRIITYNPLPGIRIRYSLLSNKRKAGGERQISFFHDPPEPRRRRLWRDSAVGVVVVEEDLEGDARVQRRLLYRPQGRKPLPLVLHHHRPSRFSDQVWPLPHLLPFSMGTSWPSLISMSRSPEREGIMVVGRSTNYVNHGIKGSYDIPILF